MVLSIKNLEIIDETYYCDGEPVTDFTVEFLGHLVRWENGIPNSYYKIRIITTTKQKVVMDVSAADMNSVRWIYKIPFAVWCKNKKKFTGMLITAIKTQLQGIAPIEVIYDRVGFVERNCEWIFLRSNGSISKRGFGFKEHSGIQRYNFLGKVIMEQEERGTQIEEFICLLKQNIEIYYPLFLITLMSVVRLPLRKQGIELGITVWLYGNSGSGKTELAEALAVFTEVNEFGNKELMYATTSKRYILETLSCSKGMPVILDDVKQEKVQGQRDHCRIAVDAVLRGVFQGCLTENYGQKDTSVDTCAVITGEYMETTESQNARLLYKDVSGFLEDKGNSESLRKFQRNSRLLPGIIGDFICWLCMEMEDQDVLDKWKKHYHRGQDEESIYANVPNGARLKANDNMMRFMHYIWMKYITDTGFNNEGLKVEFQRKGEYSIQKIVEDTSLLLGGLEALLVQAMTEVVQTSRIRHAKYRRESLLVCDGCVWQQQEFCLWEEDDFLYIDDIERSWSTKSCEQSADIRGILVIGRDKLLDKMLYVVDNKIKQGVIPEHFLDKVSLGAMARCGLIACSLRDEKQYRYAKYYPCIAPKDEEEIGEYFSDYCNHNLPRNQRRRTVEYKRDMVVQCNLGHSAFAHVLDCMIEDAKEGMLSGVENTEVMSMRRAFSQRKVLLKSVSE